MIPWLTCRRTGSRLATLAVLAGMLANGIVSADTKGAAATQAGAAKNSEAVVRVSASADRPDAAGNQVVTVTLAIDEGWHVYANPPGLGDLASVQTTLTVNTRVEGARVAYPPGRVIKDGVLGDYLVYDGTTGIKGYVRRAAGDTGPLQVSVRFQACCHVPGHEKCLTPATVTVVVP